MVQPDTLESRPPSPPHGFEAAARSILSDVRGAYGELLTALGGPTRASEVQARLRLDKKLAWRLRRLADVVDPLSGASFVPSRASAGRVVKAARTAGVAAPIADRVLTATESFQAFVDDRASDRACFDAMAAALCGEGLDPILLDARRSAHRAAVLIHGKSSEAMLYAFAMAPGVDGEHVTGVSLRGQVGLQRLRPSASIELTRHRFESDGVVLGGYEPLDEEAAARLGAPVLPEFCSPDLPALIQQETVGGFRSTTLAEADLGLAGSTTYVMGNRTATMPLDPVANGSLCETRTPTRRLVHDLWVHESLPLAPPELRVVEGRHATEAWPEPTGPGVLDTGARVVDLGPGLEGTDLLVGIPQARLYARCFERMGWDPRAMRLFRVVVEYPVPGSISWLRARRR